MNLLLFLTQATVEGCKLYSITSDLDVHTEDLAEEKITKSQYEKKKKHAHDN